MIKLFRRIRLSLLNEGNTGKYLQYAIGEIVLVVIGILIALQINTWNEDRIKKHLEGSYLAEIRDNLVTDTTNINKALDFHLKKEASILHTLELLADAARGDAYLEEFYQNMEILTYHMNFESVRTAFDNMVSSDNIGIIRNRNIRSGLSAYYSGRTYENGTQERALELTRSFTDEVTTSVMSRELLKSYTGAELDLKSASQLQLYSDEQVISRLFVMRRVCESLRSELSRKKEGIQNLMDQIESELDTRWD